MVKKNLALYFAIIIFMSYIEIFAGQVSAGPIRGLRAYSQSIITTQSNTHESEIASSEDTIFTTNLKESSIHTELATTYKFTNYIDYPTYFIFPTIKTSDSSASPTNSEEFSTDNSIPESSSDTTSISYNTDHTDTTTSSNQESSIPKSNPSTEIIYSNTNENTDNSFSSTPTNDKSYPSENIKDFTSNSSNPSTDFDLKDSSDLPTIITTSINPTNYGKIPTIPTTIPNTYNPNTTTATNDKSYPSENITYFTSNSPNPSTDFDLKYSSDLPTIITTSINPTNYEKIPTIPTTIPNTYNPNTTTATPTTIPDNNPSLILVGFSHYKYDSNISFYIYFSLKEGYIYSNNLKFPVEITYNTNLRLLQNNEAICNQKGIMNKKVIYYCEIKTENQNINNVKVIPEFNFNSQTANVTISSFANKYINNIQNIGNELNVLYDSNFYELTKSQINKGENRIFNITGIINEPQPKFQKISLVLTAIIENGNDKIETDINCNIIDINKNNYILQCKVYDNKKYVLQNSLSIINDEILLINFDDYNDSIVQFIYEPDAGLDAASVIAIIIVIIFFGYFI